MQQLRHLVYFASLLLFLSSHAHAQSFGNLWPTADMQWKRGFVFAIATFNATVRFSNTAESHATTMGFKQCLGNNITDHALVGAVDNYWMRNPTAATEPLVAVVQQTIAEMCAPHLPKAR